MLSLIVPVYNAEKYVARCVDSILSQSFIDFELLLIDDGSKDRSGEICDEYAAKDSRIRVFHKPNGGVSSARNMGIDNAQGEWVMFVDADDYLLNGSLSSMLPGNDADLVVGGCFHVCHQPESRQEKIPPHDRLVKIRDNVQYIDDLLWRIYFTTPWCKLFRTDVIRDKHLLFDHLLYFGEDTDFVFRYLLHVNTVQFVSKAVYFYEEPIMKRSVRYPMDMSSLHKLTHSIGQDLNAIGSRFGGIFETTYVVLMSCYSNMFFENLLGVGSYQQFLQEMKILRSDSESFYPDSLKKKVLKWLITHNLKLSYLVLKIYRWLQR